MVRYETDGKIFQQTGIQMNATQWTGPRGKYRTDYSTDTKHVDRHEETTLQKTFVTLTQEL